MPDDLVFSVTVGSRENPRIGLLGPSLPYRGGVAQYTTELHRALSRHCMLHTISFKRLYPDFLYPGKSNIEPGYEGYKEPGVRYIIDSVNPSTWWQAYRSFDLHSVPNVIIEWWTAFHAPCLWFISKCLERKGIKVTFLCHNVFDHERAIGGIFLSRAVLSKRKAFLVHSQKDAATIKRLVPEARVRLHPHPIFENFRRGEGTLPRRARLELLFFGFVRPYKGLDVLIDAMHLLTAEDVFLTVVGEWWSSARKLKQDIVRLRKIEVIDRYVREEEAAGYFRRADVVILPYRDASGTGVIPLAYHYGKPVIASRVGGIPDYVRDGLSGRLVEPGNPHALAAAIREFLSNAPATREGIQEASAKMTFTCLATCIIDFLSREI